MADLPHALQKPWRSLVDVQDSILAGKFGNTLGQLKHLEDLLVADLREELKARNITIDGKKNPQLQLELTELLQGAQSSHPTQSKHNKISKLY